MPSTGYNVYCFTTSLTAGTVMSLSNMLNTKQTVHTACCRTVSVTPQLSYASTGSVVTVNALTVSVDVLPDAGSFFILSLSSSYLSSAPSSSPVILPAFVPATINVTSTSGSTFTVNYVSPATAAVGGAQTITATITSSSMVGGTPEAGRYGAVAFIRSNVLTIFGTGSVINIPAPVMSMVQFSNDASQLMISFSAATNKASGSATGVTGTFACSALFTLGASNSNMCQWSVDGTALTVFLSASSSASLVNVGDTLALKAGSMTMLRAACGMYSADVCSAWPSTPAQSMNVAAPVSPIRPNLVVAVPSVLGACSDLMVDLSSSTGSGGSARAWSSLTFTVSFLHANGSSPYVDNVYSSNIATYLRSNFGVSKIAQPFTIPAAQFLESGLPVNGVLTIAFHLCNFFGQCSDASSGSISVLGSEVIPVITITGGYSRSVARNQPLNIQSNAYVKGSCGGNATSTGLTNTWSVVGHSWQSTSIDPTLFSLPPYTFNYVPGVTYSVVLTVYNAATGLSTTSAPVQVSIVSAVGGLVAFIQGATSRSVNFNTTAVLDGSASYDVNSMIPGVSQGSFSSITWSCAQTSPSLLTNCPHIMITPDNLMASLSTSNALANGTVSTVTLTLVSSSGEVNSASVTVTIAAAGSPEFTFTSVVGPVNPNNALSLGCSVELFGGVGSNIVWSISDSSINLASAALTPVTQMLSPPAVMSASTTYAANLKIMAGVLYPRSSFTFTLTATVGANHYTGSITVMTNGPPLSGSLSVSPWTGTELTTNYMFSTVGWTSQELPLNYEFGVYSSSSAPSACRALTDATYGSCLLGRGDSTMNYNATTYVKAQDSIGMYSYAMMMVQVKPIANTDALYNNIGDSLSNAQGAAGMTNALSSASTSVNQASVDCSAITAGECSADYNRQGCKNTANTCGSCMAGYVGVDGDSNTVCIAEVARRRLTDTGRKLTGAHCNTDSDCTGGNPWMTCMSHQCILPKQACSASCSNCQAMDVSTGELLPAGQACYVGDFSCAAVCVCAAGMTGVNCDVAVSGLASVQSVRAQLLQVLTTLTHSQSATPSTVTNWLNTLASIVASYSCPPEQLTVPLIENSLSLLSNVILPAVTAVGSIDVTSASVQTTINGIVDGCASALASINSQNQIGYNGNGRRLTMLMPVNNTVVMQLQQVHTQYVQMVLDSMVAGQSDVNIITSQSRISCQYRSVVHTNGAVTPGMRSLMLPLTAGEQVSMVPPSAINITYPDSNSIVKVALISYNLLLFDNSSSSVVDIAGGAFTANPVSLYLDDVSVCDFTDNSVTYQDCKVYLELVNTMPEAYERANGYNTDRDTYCHNGTVVGMGSQVTEDHTCGSITMTSSCTVDSSVVGVANLSMYWDYYIVHETCPIPISYPTCAGMGGNMGLNCTVEDSSSSSTVCVCTTEFPPMATSGMLPPVSTQVTMSSIPSSVMYTLAGPPSSSFMSRVQFVQKNRAWFIVFTLLIVAILVAMVYREYKLRNPEVILVKEQPSATATSIVAGSGAAEEVSFDDIGEVTGTIPNRNNSIPPAQAGFANKWNNFVSYLGGSNNNTAAATTTNATNATAGTIVTFDENNEVTLLGDDKPAPHNRI